MPTRHRRIAIIRDEQVEAALGAVRAVSSEDESNPQSDAGLARELLLAGARVVAGELRTEDDFRRWVIEQGGTPPQRSMNEVMGELRKRLPPIDPDDPYKGQRILEELREEKI